MSDSVPDDVYRLALSFVAAVSSDDPGDDPAGRRPYETAARLRSVDGEPARLGDLLMLELEARALAPLLAVVGDLPEPEVISGVAMRYWVFADAAQRRAESFGDAREGQLLGGALEAGAARIRGFYEGLGDRLEQRSDSDGEPEDELDPEALDIVVRLREHVGRRLEWLVDRSGERFLDPDEGHGARRRVLRPRRARGPIIPTRSVMPSPRVGRCAQGICRRLGGPIRCAGHSR